MLRPSADQALLPTQIVGEKRLIIADQDVATDTTQTFLLTNDVNVHSLLPASPKVNASVFAPPNLGIPPRPDQTLPYQTLPYRTRPHRSVEAALTTASACVSVGCLWIFPLNHYNTYVLYGNTQNQADSTPRREILQNPLFVGDFWWILGSTKILPTGYHHKKKLDLPDPAQDSPPRRPTQELRSIRPTRQQ